MLQNDYLRRILQYSDYIKEGWSAFVYLLVESWPLDPDVRRVFPILLVKQESGIVLPEDQFDDLGRRIVRRHEAFLDYYRRFADFSQLLQSASCGDARAEYILALWYKGSQNASCVFLARSLAERSAAQGLERAAHLLARLTGRPLRLLCDVEEE